MARITYPSAPAPTVIVLDGEHNPAYYLDRGAQPQWTHADCVNYESARELITELMAFRSSGSGSSGLRPCRICRKSNAGRPSAAFRRRAARARCHRPRDHCAHPPRLRRRSAAPRRRDLMDEADRYRLSPAANERIFREEIIPELTAGLTAADRPGAVVLAASRALGKARCKVRPSLNSRVVAGR